MPSDLPARLRSYGVSGDVREFELGAMSLCNPLKFRQQRPASVVSGAAAHIELNATDVEKIDEAGYQCPQPQMWIIQAARVANYNLRHGK